MDIDRSNYEIWFIDYIDGKLSEMQEEQLKIFLVLNPGLKEELEELSKSLKEIPYVSFSKKKTLHKTPSEIDDEQFNFLCAAYIEKDLTPEAAKELNNIINGNPERQKTLELFLKTRLKAPDVTFSKKSRLIRLTPVQNVIKVSATGLSIAASVAILVTLILPSLRRFPGNNSNISGSIINDGRAMHSFVAIPSDIDNNKIIYSLAVHSDLNANLKPADPAEVPAENIQLQADNSLRHEEIISHAEVSSPVHLPDLFQEDMLKRELASSNISLLHVADNSRPVGKFIAKTFREYILKEQKADDSPVKGYEIAEAGITGLNKLLGWQMALVKNSDDKGEVKSVSFNSRLLKIQAPVNRHESSE